MADTAIGFEAPELDLSAGTTDDGAELDSGAVGATADDTATGAADGADGATEGDGAEAGKPFLAVENGKLSAVAKATIEKLKAENPQLAKAVQRALFAEDRLRREIPGGFKEISSLREKIEALGGDEGITGLQTEIGEFRQFDTLLTAGDPKALDFLLTNKDGTPNELGHEALAKIAPVVFEKFSELNPNGYAAYVAQVMAADMGQYEYEKGKFTSVPALLERLGDVIPPENASARKLVEVLSGYVQRVLGIARNPVVAPAATTKQATDPRAADLDTREQNLRRQEWEGEAGAQHSRIFTDAWKRLAVNVPADKEALVRKLYKANLDEKLAAKKDFHPNMDRYLKAKQKDGFLRLHESTFKDAVPLALRSAMAEAGIGARKAPAAAAKPGDGAKPAVPARPAAGFTPIAAKPSMGEVNNILTSPTMWQAKQAILRNGKRVTWA